MNKEIKKVFKRNSIKTPEKNIYLENTPSNPHLSLQKIDEFEAISKDSLKETLIQMVLEEESHPVAVVNERTSIANGKMSIEEDFLE